MHSSLELLFKKQEKKEGESMTLDEMIVKACCICHTVTLPDGKTVNEVEAKSQGYVLTHTIGSKFCFQNYYSDVLKGSAYLNLPDTCRFTKEEKELHKEVDVNAESYDKDQLFNNGRN